MRSPRHTSPRLLGRLTSLVLVAVLAACGIGAAATITTRSQPNWVAAKAKRIPMKFRISGRVVQPLHPGRTVALNLRLTNRSRYALRISRIRIGLVVDRMHAKAGCRAKTNFVTRGLTRRGRYRLLLPRKRTRTLRQLRVPVRRLPAIGMRNLRTNQDVCKGARITLRYRGVAHRAGKLGGARR